MQGCREAEEGRCGDIGKASLSEWCRIRSINGVPNGGVLDLDKEWPICRTVEDVVYVLDVIAGFDPRDDEATREGFKFIPEGGYKQFLKNEGLKGKRLGVVRSPFVDKLHDSMP
ncbi:putative amidase [Camellia lanceoleosa]|uniref:Amidase n=1 Tax=Camellia lanceoleosa TaxID=1840588 RepID=A0ACC0IKA1_9ERIC|nr:putative amidase [Camellia lanceoleosa]